MLSSHSCSAAFAFASSRITITLATTTTAHICLSALRPIPLHALFPSLARFMPATPMRRIAFSPRLMLCASPASCLSPCLPAATSAATSAACSVAPAVARRPPLGADAIRMAAASHTVAQTGPQTRVAAAGGWSALSECGAEPPVLTAADFPVHYARRTARPAPKIGAAKTGATKIGAAKTGATKTGTTKGQTKTLQTAKRVSAAAPVVHGVARKPVVASKVVPVAKHVTTRAPVKAAVPVKATIPAKVVLVKTRIPCPVKTAPVKAVTKAPVNVVVALPKVVSVPKKAMAKAPAKAVVAQKAVVQAKIVTPPKVVSVANKAAAKAVVPPKIVAATKPAPPRVLVPVARAAAPRRTARATAPLPGRVDAERGRYPALSDDLLHADEATVFARSSRIARD